MFKKNGQLIFLIALFVIVCSVPSQASVKMLKVYREVNKDLKPDCMYCHLDKQPKKDKGKHELNDYGKKIDESVKAEKQKLTEEQLKALYNKIFKEVGRHDNFNKPKK